MEKKETHALASIVYIENDNGDFVGNIYIDFTHKEILVNLQPGYRQIDIKQYISSKVSEKCECLQEN